VSRAVVVSFLSLCAINSVPVPILLYNCFNVCKFVSPAYPENILSVMFSLERCKSDLLNWSDSAASFTGSLFADSPSVCKVLSKLIQFPRRYTRKRQERSSKYRRETYSFLAHNELSTVDVVTSAVRAVDLGEISDSVSRACTIIYTCTDSPDICHVDLAMIFSLATRKISIMTMMMMMMITMVGNLLLVIKCSLI